MVVVVRWRRTCERIHCSETLREEDEKEKKDDYCIEEEEEVLITLSKVLVFVDKKMVR